MGFLRRQVRRAVRRLLEIAFEAPFEDIKRPKMVYGWTNSDGTFRPHTRISDSTHVHARENVKIADEVFIGHFTWLDGTELLEIGRGAQISGRAGIFTHSSHDSIRDSEGKEHQFDGRDLPGFIKGAVKIGEYAFIGTGATILPGIEVGSRAIVGAGAVVNRHVEPYAIVAGNPARVIGDVRNRKPAP